MLLVSFSTMKMVPSVSMLPRIMQRVTISVAPIAVPAPIPAHLPMFLTFPSFVLGVGVPKAWRGFECVVLMVLGYHGSRVVVDVLANLYVLVQLCTRMAWCCWGG